MARETTIRNMWDVVTDHADDGAALPDPGPPSAPQPTAEDRPKSPMARRNRRVNTRLLGFEHSNGAVESLDHPGATSPVEPVRFPVGWLAVVGGPGLGASFALRPGVALIGRGGDQTVCLDFGDTSISRDSHAIVAYDEEAQGFFVSHGGKSNIVRLNGKPVLSTEPLRHGDRIRLGETTLQLAALCDDSFAWDAGGARGGAAPTGPSSG